MNLTALVTIFALFTYGAAGIQVARARRRYKIAAPATTGDPAFERAFRAQQNTLEWMPTFLAPLWLCAWYVSDKWAALVGLVWVVGRILYIVMYARAAEKRGTGFAIQALASGVLTVSALVGILRAMIAG